MLWINYRHSILEKLLAKPKGIRECELIKASSMGRRNFFKVIKLLEKAGMIEKRTFSKKLIYFKPSKQLMFLTRMECENLEYLLMDIEDIIFENIDNLTRWYDGQFKAV
jgi:predicted transcriptional regulator